MSWLQAQPELVYSSRSGRRQVIALPQQQRMRAAPEMIGVSRRQRVVMPGGISTGSFVQGTSSFISGGSLDMQGFYDMPVAVSPPPISNRIVRPQMVVTSASPPAMTQQFIPSISNMVPMNGRMVQQHMLNLPLDTFGAPMGSIKGPQQVLVPAVDKNQYVYSTGQGYVRLPGGQVTSGRVMQNQNAGMLEAQYQGFSDYDEYVEEAVETDFSDDMDIMLMANRSKGNQQKWQQQSSQQKMSMQGNMKERDVMAHRNIFTIDDEIDLLRRIERAQALAGEMMLETPLAPRSNKSDHMPTEEGVEELTQKRGYTVTGGHASTGDGDDADSRLLC